MTFRPLYFTRRAMDAMIRGPYVTLIGTATIFVAVFATGLFAAALGGAERLLAAWAGEVRISIYLAPGADLAAARAAAAAAAPGREVRAVTSAEALRDLAVELGDEARVLEGVGPGALSDEVQVAAPGISLAEARALAARLRSVPGAADVDYGEALLGPLERFVRRARTTSAVLFAALALATAVLVSNTLRLAVFARRDEIEIMKLVGATDAFVAAPFLIEGLAQGLLGGGLAAGGLLAAYAAVSPRLHAAGLGRLLTVRDALPPSLLLALVAGGALVGLLGSALSVARTLRRISTS
ncbi:cell division protein FtsX [Anaeromyxobacter oryzisoli]|uniref:cell division protein FtsX n=1 Tax=Anaeromyxobacter oryzisoli TaxID=2925408 RepID=UPI001F59E9B7|nr:FtsX-like permease family protein [Anaeromyxobacter sp. SG63]